MPLRISTLVVLFLRFFMGTTTCPAFAATLQDVDGCWETSLEGRQTYTLNSTDKRERFTLMYQTDGTLLTRAWVRFDAVEQEGGTVYFVNRGDRIIAMRPLAPALLEQASPKGRDPSPREWTRSTPETEARIRALIPDFAELNGQWRIQNSADAFLTFDAPGQQIQLLEPQLVKRFGSKPLRIHSFVLLPGELGTTIHLSVPGSNEHLWLHMAGGSKVLGLGKGSPVKPEVYIARGTKAE